MAFSSMSDRFTPAPRTSSSSGPSGPYSNAFRTLATAAPTGPAPGTRDAKGKYTPLDPNAAAGTLTGQVITARRADFNRRYRPLEQKTVAMVSKAPTAEANTAAATAQTQGRLTRESFMRDIQRSGIKMSGLEQQAANKKLNLSAGLDKVNAYNQTYRALEARNTDAMGETISIGKGIAGASQQGLSSAAGMQSGREAAGDAAKQQHKAQTMSTIGSIAGIAAAVFL